MSTLRFSNSRKQSFSIPEELLIGSLVLFVLAHLISKRAAGRLIALLLALDFLAESVQGRLITAHFQLVLLDLCFQVLHFILPLHLL